MAKEFKYNPFIHRDWEIWEGDGESCLLLKKSPQHSLLTHDVYGKKMRLTKEFVADSYEAAKKIYYKHMGYE